MSFPTISRLNTPALTPPLTLQPEFDPQFDPFYLPPLQPDKLELGWKKKPLTLFPDGECCELKLDTETKFMLWKIRNLQRTF